VASALSLSACGGGGGGGGGGDDEPVEFVVRSIDPLDGATNRPNDASLTILLSKAVDPRTVGHGTFHVVESGTTELHPGTHEVSSDGLRVTFFPEPWFDTATIYDVTVNQSLRALDGDYLIAALSTSFKTAPWPSPEHVEQDQFFELFTKMNSSRSYHTSTLVVGGNVLLTGGYTTGGFTTSSAELFLPSTTSFLLTGSMSVARANHTATRLQSGLVLVVGGERPDDLTGLNSAETYSPATGKFTTTDSMTFGRTAHTATLLNNGKVLVTGGKSGFGASRVIYRSAEVYDPVSMTWSGTANTMELPRWGHRATLLPSGDVLITGGADERKAEIYEVDKNRFRTVSDLMNGFRAQHNAVLLTSGLVLLSDGGELTGEYFDPATELFTPTAGRSSVTRYESVAFEYEPGLVLIIGGYEWTAGFTSIFLHSSIEQFDQNYAGSGSYFHVPSLPDIGVYLRDSRAYSRVSRLNDGRYLITGGLGPSYDEPDLDTAVLFNPDG
jgi:hypothetical protein